MVKVVTVLLLSMSQAMRAPPTTKTMGFSVQLQNLILDSVSENISLGWVPWDIGLWDLHTGLLLGSGC
jgi:hypothetical protein